MKKKYELEGMSCGGCVNNVKRTLLELPDVIEAEVQLQPPIAVLTMSKSVEIDALQAQLEKSGHYKIKEIVSK